MKKFKREMNCIGAGSGDDSGEDIRMSGSINHVLSKVDFITQNDLQ